MIIEKRARQIERVETSQSKIDLSLFRKRGKATTYKGYLIQKMKEAKEIGNLELVMLIQHFYKKYLEYETSQEVRLKSWKGKDKIQFIEKPDRFIVITHQKEDQDSPPKDSYREISKEELNNTLKVINRLWQGKKLHSRIIGEALYGQKWETTFSDRFLHTQYNFIMRTLDYLGIIHYRGKFTTLLKQINEIQSYIK